MMKAPQWLMLRMSFPGLQWLHHISWRPDPQQPGRASVQEWREDHGHQPSTDRQG